MEIVLAVMKLLGGVGIFLVAMYLLEESLKNLSGRRFKRFLQRASENRFTAVGGGAVVTGVLQSSSMVSLMVLAFVGAGVFTMKNAMAIILGANLGTTLDSWLVATLGFKVDIEVAAYPAVFVGGLMLILAGKRKNLQYIAFFLLGFGMLFIGLAFMKDAMEAQVKHFDFKQYAHMPLIVFLGIGFMITLLVQSSSVTMALTLSALHAGAFGFAPAAALVLGSETGTTLKLGLSALGGTAAKKRVALGNIIFNVVLTILAFTLLKFILLLITDVFKIKDPLIGLVTFSTLVNVVSIAIFLPLLDPFAKLLEKFFKNTDASAAAFINSGNADEPQTAYDLLQREAAYFIFNAMLFNLQKFEIDTAAMESNEAYKQVNDERKFSKKPPEEKYEFVKQLEGEIQAFYLQLRKNMDGNNELNKLVAAVRNGMYAVKGINDIGTNITDLRQSSKDLKFEFFKQHQKETEALYTQLYNYFKQGKPIPADEAEQLQKQVKDNYNTALNHFYKQASEAPIEDIDITTALNFNRELFSSNQALVNAMVGYLEVAGEGG
jgi:phosphate:Na+ symporter